MVLITAFYQEMPKTTLFRGPMPDFTLHEGDCLAVLKTMPDNSIDSVVTDPPYELGFMGKGWDATGIANSVPLWTEVLRVLKPGGYMVAFSSARTYHRMVCAIEDAGFVIHPLAAWIFGTGFPKATNLSKQIDRAAGAEREVIGVNEDWLRRKPNGSAGVNSVGFSKETDYNIYAPATEAAKQWDGWFYGLQSLKPALEPICMAQKPFEKGLNGYGNVLRWGTGALNIDGCRVPSNDGFEKAWDRPVITNISSSSSAYGIGTGTTHKVDLSANRPVGGRWPANCLHDGSDEVVGMFPVTGASKASAGRNGRDKGDVFSFNRASDDVRGHDDAGGSAARFFYSAKASRHDRCGSKHPTVKPVNLMRWLVRLITPPGGTVLDPFAGSGTTGLAARLEGFRSVMIEREPEYQADIKTRMATTADLLTAAE